MRLIDGLLNRNVPCIYRATTSRRIVRESGEMTMTSSGKNRITIFGPRPDGVYCSAAATSWSSPQALAGTRPACGDAYANEPGGPESASLSPPTRRAVRKGLRPRLGECGAAAGERRLIARQVRRPVRRTLLDLCRHRYGTLCVVMRRRLPCPGCSTASPDPRFARREERRSMPSLTEKTPSEHELGRSAGASRYR
jgi:hypothetical protein